MGRNLSTLNIKDTYEGLVQISGSILTDGTGSVIPSLDITASFATSASYAISSSADDLTLQDITNNGATTTLNITSAGFISGNRTYASNAIGAPGENLFGVSGGGAGSRMVLSGDGTISGNQITLGKNDFLDVYSITITGSTDFKDSINISQSLTASGINYPATDGTNGQAITTDGSGNLTFNDVITPTPTLQEVSDVGATTTNLIQLQNGLVITGSVDQLKVKDDTGNAVFSMDVNGINGNVQFKSNVGFPNELDITPGYDIFKFINVSGSTANITTALTASGLIYPTTDGTNGQVIKTDGLGNLTFGNDTDAQDLQSTTDIGNTTTNPIVITSNVAKSLTTQGGIEISSSTFPTLEIQSLDALADPTLLFQSGSTYIGYVAGTSTHLELGDFNSSKVKVSGSSLEVDLAFTASGLQYPATDGTNGQAITTDGSGNLTFTSVITPTPNLQEVLDTGNTAIQNIVLTGSLSVSGSTQLIGNIDNGDTEQKVQLGAYGGSSINASVVNGAIISAGASTIGSSAQYNAFIAGTDSSTINNCNNSAIVGGNSHTNEADKGFIGGGEGNYIQRGKSAVIGGANNRCEASGERQVIAGGADNKCSSLDSFIGGGENNIIGRDNNDKGIILGGVSNIITGSATNIDAQYNTIINSQGSNIEGATLSAIMYSSGSLILDKTGSIIIGGSNITSSRDNEVVIPALTSIGEGRITGSLSISATSNNSNTAGSLIVGTGITNSGDGQSLLVGQNINDTGGGGANIMSGNNITKSGFSAYNAIIGTFSTTFTGGNMYANVIAGGNNHKMITAKSSNALLGGNNNTIRNNDEVGAEPANSILGGRYNTISGSNGYNAIIGGYGNLITGATGSIILGGNAITASADYTTYMENANIKGSVVGSVGTLTDVAGTTTMDCSLGNFFTYSALATDTTLTATNIQAGQTINVKFTQNATPSLFTFDTMFEFADGTPFVVSTTAGAVDVMTFISFDGTTLQATGINNFS